MPAIIEIKRDSIMNANFWIFLPDRCQAVGQKSAVSSQKTYFTDASIQQQVGPLCRPPLLIHPRQRLQVARLGCRIVHPLAQ